MNIFFFDSNPYINASYYPDIYRKIILEIGQMASTAKQILDEKTYEECYKITHQNHPMTKWVGFSFENYLTAIDIGIILIEEFRTRFKKIHKTYKVLSFLEFNPPKKFPHSGYTSPPLCMPDQYKSDDVVKSYRDYFRAEKFNKIKCKWTNRKVPHWL